MSPDLEMSRAYQEVILSEVRRGFVAAGRSRRTR